MKVIRQTVAARRAVVYVLCRGHVTSVVQEFHFRAKGGQREAVIWQTVTLVREARTFLSACVHAREHVVMYMWILVYSCVRVHV